MITFKLDVLEDILPKDTVQDYGLERAYAPQSLIDYWTQALTRLETHPALTSPTLNPDLTQMGFGKDPIVIEVLLCSQSSIEEFIDLPNALGVHLISTPDSDPFNEDSAYARSLRVLVVSDKDKFLEHITENADLDVTPENYLIEYLTGYLNTMFHEISHALLFAENSALLPPSEIDILSDAGDIHNDIFDCSTAYGIKALMIEDTPVWADSIEEANIHMETYVEALGYQLLFYALKDAQDIFEFPKAMEVDTEVQNLIYK